MQKSDAEYVKARLRDYCENSLIPEMRAIHPDAAITNEVIGEVDGLEPMEKNEARDLVMELTGANQADVVPFGTEAGIFQDLGLNVVVCGPGSIEQAHKPDEFVSASQIQQCLDMLKRLAVKLSE